MIPNITSLQLGIANHFRELKHNELAVVKMRTCSITTLACVLGCCLAVNELELKLIRELY